MDDTSQGSRRTRPASSTSSYNTRMTPSSTNSSAMQLPHIQRTNSMRASGAALLQERLRERKEEMARKERRGSMDLTANMERGSHSSPAKIADHRRPSSGGVNGRGMGVKQVEEQVTTLHKQNFDLKLELYHRRQRQEALEAQLEAAEKRLVEQAEWQEINEQLLVELERRDCAVEEAMCQIAFWEDKANKLMQDRDDVRAFEADYEPSYFHEDHEAIPSSPPQLEKSRRGVLRMPSFLSETTEGTEALRSLYLPNHSSYSDAPLPKLMEDGTNDGMNSPRLSVLSESSFLSIYGDKNLPMDEPVVSPHRHRASASIEKWVDERPIITPARPTPPVRKNHITNQFISFNDVLDSPSQRLERFQKLKDTLEKTNRGLQSVPAHKSSVEKRQSKEVRQLFTSRPRDSEHPHALPPTPDTISTNTLRSHQVSNDSLAENKKTTYVDNPTSKNDAYAAAQSMRPQSAGETVTSRRDGHGWDTASQDTPTETGTDASITTFASQRYAKTGRIVTPNLFSFTAGGWGKEVIYDHDVALPAHTARSRQGNRDRRDSMVKTPTSDGTTVKQSSSSSEGDSPKYGTTQIDTTTPPNLPDRRSSLIAATKLRKTHVPSHPPSYEPLPITTTTAPMPQPAKRSRMASLRIFGRSEATPAPVSTASVSNSTISIDSKADGRESEKSRAQSRAMSYVDHSSNLRYDTDDDARATPPPIQRTRGGGVNGPPMSYRPSSAGGLAGMERGRVVSESDGGNGHRRRGSVGLGGLGGLGGVRDGVVSAAGAGSRNGGGGGRKWFGIAGSLGRSGSLRRT